MSEIENLRYYVLLQKLLKVIMNIRGVDPEDVKVCVKDFCDLFHIERADTRFYHNEALERVGKGDILIGYDSGEESVPVMSIRHITKVKAVITCTAYRKKDAEPFTADEEEKVGVVMKTLLSFVSRRRLEGVVEMMFYHDDDGYLNFPYFQRWLEESSEKDQLKGKIAIHYNLLHFSLINQEIGRAAGDIVMRNHFEGVSSIVSKNGIVCRLGGDNFVVICDKDNIDKLISYLEATPVVYDAVQNKRIRVAASAGIFQMPEDFVYLNNGQVMDKIVTASLAARRNGVSAVYFEKSLIETKERLSKLQKLLPDALRNEEFAVFYQPKVNIVTGKLSGAEALCRWFRDGKIVPPMQFIPLLEQTDDICKLDFYMLDHVCRDIRRWLDTGKNVVRISVNFSRKHMMDVDLLKNIIEIVDRNNVPHEYIEIELTETTTDVEFRDLKRVVGGLQQAGVCTSVDDFGMGYSSLNLIREIPWNVLKVDRSFLPIDEDDQNSIRSIMFKYVVAMAKEMGLECIAEGVETKDQVEVLRQNKCGFAQGYFFDKPLPLAEFENRLDGNGYSVDL